MRTTVVIAAVLALSGCHGATKMNDNTPRPVHNDRGVTESPTPDQCNVPVDQRKGGWFCYGTSSSMP